MIAEETIYGLGGGLLFGFIAGWAFKKIVKLAAIIIGGFILVLAYLSYKGWISANWLEIEHQTKDMALNATQQAVDMINKAASQFHQTQMTPVIAGLGFVIGFGIGVTRK